MYIFLTVIVFIFIDIILYYVLLLTFWVWAREVHNQKQR